MTDKELARSPLPHLPQRLSQRQSSGRTQAVNARTFKELREWPNFLARASDLSSGLDDVQKRNVNLMSVWRAGLQSASDECAIRGCLEQILFPQVNDLAKKLGFTLEYMSGGSGRAFSFTDMVIIDITQSQDLRNLSARVYGNGEGKGHWQWEVLARSFEEALNSPLERKKCIEVLQQLYGDMVNDESIVGFISNYSQSVFFYRDDAASKSLFLSPIVKIDDAPLEKFLYVLEFAEQRKHLKPSMSRVLVTETPTQGYTLSLPQIRGTSSSGRTLRRNIQNVQVKAQRKKRRQLTADLDVYSEEELHNIPAYPLEDLGVTGGVVALGKHGNILQGEVQGERVALKTFDLRRETAQRAFLTELKIYHHLKNLQGLYLPSLVVVGRLPHTSVLYLGLTNEPKGPPIKDLVSERGVKMAVREALASIHREGVLHGDLSLSNMLFHKGKAKFIDFEYSTFCETKEDFNAELLELEELFREARMV